MSQSTGQRLDSWKEIAIYLGRDLRTLRRWEKEKGLPVHRVPGGARQAVFAYKTEIDAWLLRADTHASQPYSGHAACNPARPVSDGAEPDSASSTTRPTAPPAGWWWKPMFTLRRATLAVLLLALAAAVAFGLILINARVFGQGLDKVAFSGNSLQGWSASGELRWTYSFGQPLREGDEKDPSRIQFLGEGPQKRVLATPPLYVPGQPNPSSDPLFALSSAGELLWRHDFNQTFQFGGSSFGPPWIFGALLVTPEGHSPHIWVAADDVFWSPASLVKLDQTGRVLANFVNWGHIHVLNYFTSPQGSFILAGGINNECDCAMLAVLRAEQPSGSSPAVTPTNGSPELRCDNCPGGHPYRYILFPRSEINIATGTTYNQVKVILPADGSIRVGVSETNSGGEPIGYDWEMFDLSSDFIPRTFSVSDHVRTLHQQLEAQGKIKHSVESCPDLHHARSVKVWSIDEGWKTLPAQPITRS